MHMIRMTAYLIIALPLVIGAGCGSEQKTVTEPPVTPEPVPEPVPPELPEEGDTTGVEDTGLEGGDVEVDFPPVYFEFDSVFIHPDQRDTLDELADYLQQNPDVTLLVEGHTDERGTAEYNIALGQRRAQEVHDYLRRLGVDGSRIATISYGEERPAAPGHDEEAWARNRRAELVPSQ